MYGGSIPLQGHPEKTVLRVSLLGEDISLSHISGKSLQIFAIWRWSEEFSQGRIAPTCVGYHRGIIAVLIVTVVIIAITTIIAFIIILVVVIIINQSLTHQSITQSINPSSFFFFLFLWQVQVVAPWRSTTRFFPSPSEKSDGIMGSVAVQPDIFEKSWASLKVDFHNLNGPNGS